MIARYQSRISGPLLDRIDLQVEVPAVPSAVLTAAPDGEPTEAVASRVAQAQQLQRDRQGCLNADLHGDDFDRHCALDAATARFLHAAASRLGWSARGFHRVLKLGRTAADLGGNSAIDTGSLAEAIQYRRVLNVQ